MDQISRPMLIALLATVCFAAAWMTVLRPQPGGGEGTAEAAPPASGTPAAVSAPPVEPAAPAPAPAAPAEPAAPRAVTEKPAAKQAAPPSKTTVVLFAADGADDRVARDVVREVRGEDVRVVIASVADVAEHRNLIGTVEVLAAPTIVVVGPKGDARRIEGLPDAALVAQAIRATR